MTSAAQIDLHDSASVVIGETSAMLGSDADDDCVVSDEGSIYIDRSRFKESYVGNDSSQAKLNA